MYVNSLQYFLVTQPTMARELTRIWREVLIVLSLMLCIIRIFSPRTPNLSHP